MSIGVMDFSMHIKQRGEGLLLYMCQCMKCSFKRLSAGCCFSFPQAHASSPRGYMVRTKIEISVSALGQRTKAMNMTIGSNTTSEDVLRKVLEKFHMRESPKKYQLLAIAKDNAGSPGSLTCSVLGGST